MNSICRALAVSTLAVTLTGGVAAFAQDHPDQDHHQQYVKHEEWKKGAKIHQEDWARAEAVSDWQTHHLHRPPAGYEWREVDGNWVCANSDGVIFSVVVAH